MVQAPTPFGSERFVLAFHIKTGVRMVESPNNEDVDLAYTHLDAWWARVLGHVPQRQILMSDGDKPHIELCKSTVCLTSTKAGRFTVAFCESDCAVRRIYASSFEDAQAVYDQLSNRGAKILVETPAVKILKSHGVSPWVGMCADAVRAVV